MQLRPTRSLILASLTVGLVACSGAGVDPDDDGDAAPGLDAGEVVTPEAPSACGDGVEVAGEACEPGGPSDGVACADLDVRFIDGVARCRADCQFDLQGCVTEGRCGDGVLDPSEGCDDGNQEPFDGCSPICVVEAAEHEGDDALPPRYVGSAGAEVAEVCALESIAQQPTPDEPVRLRARIHVIQARGLRTASEVEIDQSLRDANLHLSRANVEIVRYGGTNLIDDAVFFDVRGDDAFWALIGVDNDPDAIDIYFVNTQTGPSGGLNGRGVVGGIPGEDGVTVSRGANAGTLAHELGHLLGLEHSHAPDDLSDTPADPGNAVCSDRSGSSRCDCAPGNDACTPDCDDGSEPEPRLVMSYYACGDDLAHSRWSPLQVRRMHCQVRNAMVYARIGSACVDRDGDGFSADPSDECPLEGVDCNDRQPTFNPMAEEICNGQDDDCDGEVDEDTDEVLGRDEGACRQCVARCVNGAIQPCDFVEPTPETCNAEDDDCDGEIDEDLDPLSEGVVMRCPDRGLCAGRARQVCHGGDWMCELPVGYMDEECPSRVADRVCAHGALDDPSCSDGVDNDCDGVRDEHNPILACEADPRIGDVGEACFASNRGRCAQRGGVYQCVQLAEGCGVSIDCVGAIFPEAERCDAEDWDCDGAAWDRNDRDGDGYGDCAGPQLDCDEGDAAVHPGAREVCDGIDNDCDGQRDEGFGMIPCGVGICRRNIPSCVAGAPQACTPQLAVVGALAEECDGLDNDCDGRADEGAACRPRIQLPNIGVFNLDLLRGDREFGGNGPSVVITVNIEPHRQEGLTVRACVDAQELGGDTGARRCETRHVVEPGRPVGLVNEDDAYFRVQYIDDDHARDDAIAERRPGSLYVPSSAVERVWCNGDQRGDDVCGGAGCVGCQIDLGSIEVQIQR